MFLGGTGSLESVATRLMGWLPAWPKLLYGCTEMRFLRGKFLFELTPWNCGI